MPTDKQIEAGKAACRTLLGAVFERLTPAELDDLASAVSRAVLEAAAKVPTAANPDRSAS